MISKRDLSVKVEKLKQNEARLTVERDAPNKTSAPFLFENGAPKVGSVYSDFSVEKFEVDHKNLTFVLDASVNLAETYKEIRMSAEIFDESKPGAHVDTPEQTAENASRLKYHREGSLKEMFGGSAEDVAAVVVSLDLTDESGAHTHVSKLDFEPGVTLIHNVIHPTKQAKCLEFGNGYDPPAPRLAAAVDDEYSGDKNDVVIALYRSPARKRDLDYLCNFGKCDPAKGNYPILGIPIKGSLEIREAEEIISSGKLKPSIVCSISAEGQNGAMVVSSSGDYETSLWCTVEGNKLSYDLTKYSWHEIYREPGSDIPKKYVYTIAFHIYYRLHGAHILELKPRYSSGEILNKDSDERLAYLVLMWGCLEENSEIIMEDGTLRKIKDISIGDRVRSADGSSREVKNIWTGTDAHCRKITCENGNSVTASPNHPFPTADGWKQASELESGDMLLNAEGEPTRVVGVEEVSKTLGIVNLEFETPTVIVANGFQSGDLAIQNGERPEEQE